MGVSQICFFRKFEFLTNLGLEAKNAAWGCRAEVVLKMTFFPFFPGEDQFEKFLARFRRAAVSHLGSSWACCQKWACGCGAEGFFPSFSGLFFRHHFCEFEKGSFETPLSSFRVLLFSAFSSWVWVDATLHVCFGAVGPEPFFSFCFCLSVYKNAVFPPEKGLFLLISLCLPFFLLGFIHFSFSLSLSIFLLFLCFPCFFFCCDLPCFFCCSLLACFFAFVFHDNNNIKILDVKSFFSSILSVSFGFLVLLSFQSPFLISVFHYLSSVCW